MDGGHLPSEAHVYDSIGGPSPRSDCPLCSIKDLMNAGETVAATVYQYVETAVVRGCPIEYAVLIALQVWNNGNGESRVRHDERRAILDAHYRLHQRSATVVYRNHMEIMRRDLCRLHDQMCVQTNQIGPIDILGRDDAEGGEYLAMAAERAVTPQIGFVHQFVRILGLLRKKLSSLAYSNAELVGGTCAAPVLPNIGPVEIPASSYCYLCHGADVRVGGMVSDHSAHRLVMQQYETIISDISVADPGLIGHKIIWGLGTEILQTIPPPSTRQHGSVTAEEFCNMCVRHFFVHDMSIRAAVYDFRHILSRASMISAAISARDTIDPIALAASNAILTAIRKLPIVDAGVPGNTAAAGLSFLVVPD